jgi:hypothetical protein
VIQLLLSAGIVVSLFLVLYFLAQRASTGVGVEKLVRARSALDILQDNLLPGELVGRIFARGDLDYVSAQGMPQLKELLVRERKKTAILWVSEILKQIRDLRKFHLGTARFYSRLSMRSEIRLAFDFLALICICRVLQLAIYFRGPYAAPRMVGRLAEVGSSVCSTSEKAMDFLKPIHSQRFANSSAGKVRAL